MYYEYCERKWNMKGKWEADIIIAPCFIEPH